MKRFLVDLGRLGLTLPVLFLTVGLARTVLELPLPDTRPGILGAAGIGLCSGIILFTFVCRLSVMYVIGHEFTHWLAAKFFLRKTGDFRVGTNGGSVAVERPNIWIALAPYFLPVYTLIWIGLYGLYCFWLSVAGNASLPRAGVDLSRLFAAGTGFTYAFHLVMTAHALRREQADLRLYGRLLSLALITCMNMAILFLAVLIAGRQWHEGLRLLVQNLDREREALQQAAQWIRYGFQ